MKRHSYRAYFALLLAVSIAPALAAGSPWNGTWKLDQAKSKMTGDTFTYSGLNGMIHYSNGSTVQFNFACDGKSYHVLADYMTTCQKANGTTYVLSSIQNGKVLSTMKQVISADGKTMISTSTGTQPDGTPYTNVTTYRRVSGTNGLLGEWKNVKASSNVPSVMNFSISGSALTLEYPGYKQSVSAKLNGPAAPITGPQVPAGAMMSFKTTGANRIDQSTMLKGKVYGQDVLTLSADGNTMTDLSWTPGKENEKQTYVFEKQ